MVWISLSKGFILNETDFSEKIIFLFFLPYDTYKIGPNFFLCIFNDMIRNFLLVLEQLLRSAYVYTVYLVDLLAFLTKDQQFWFDICEKIAPKRYNFKAWIPEETQSCLFNGTYFFSSVHSYTSQEGLIYLLLNISQANSMESQISNKLNPGEWPTSLTHENDPRVWPTRMTHENDPRKWLMRIFFSIIMVYILRNKRTKIIK